MTEKEMLKVIDEMMLSRPKYVRGDKDCEWWLRHLFALDGVELEENVFAASKEFTLVEPPLQIMDVVVFRNDARETVSNLTEARHVGVMINDREFTHFSQELGIAKCEIARSVYAFSLSHAARHKKYAASVGQ